MTTFDKRIEKLEASRNIQLRSRELSEMERELTEIIRAYLAGGSLEKYDPELVGIVREINEMY